MTRTLFIIASLFLTISVIAQPASDQQLAQYHFTKGEFDKAEPYLEKLFNKSKTKYYFSRLLTCYKELDKMKDAEKLAEKQVKRFPEDYSYKLSLGEIYELTQRSDKANDLYQEIIKDIPMVSYQISRLSDEFKNLGKYDLALQTLNKGRKGLGKKFNFNYRFADIYAIQGKTDLMIDEYLDLIEAQSNSVSTIEIILSRQFDFTEEDKDHDLLRTKILEKIRKNPSEIAYDQLLIWFFIQKKDFYSAYVQAKAMDKKEKGSGRAVYNLGMVCITNNSYATARKCFQYVIDLGEDKPLYNIAQSKILSVSYTELTTKRNFTTSELNEVLTTYKNGMTNLTVRRGTFETFMEYAEILAFYANQPQKAKTTLEDLIQQPSLTSNQKAEAKILLGDVHVVLDEIWDASVLYLQVEHDFKHDVLGHEAKYKNAKVYYYDGDFKWAQAQLDVLKASTTKLIANDALKLSLLITDNLGLDSMLAPMQLYAKADLLIQQRKYDEAFSTLDSIAGVNPFHALNDEIFMAKANAYMQQGKWELAIDQLSKIYTNHSDDILADDALFKMADIYENHLFNLEMAKEKYRKILFEYKGSLYTVEARKKFQELTEKGIQ